jgi:ribonuclease HI
MWCFTNALQAIVRVLETVPQSTKTLIIRTDSQYCKNGTLLLSSTLRKSLETDYKHPNSALTVWCFNWRKNGWITAGGRAVANKELIDYALTLLETRRRSGQRVQLEFVKGHSGNVGNNGADALATVGHSHPEVEEKDWVGLKNAHIAEQNMLAGLADVDLSVGSTLITLC